MTVIPLSIKRITNMGQFERHRAALKQLTGSFRDVLTDDFTPLSAADLVENLKSTVPHLWLSTDSVGRCWAGASLADITPHRYAFIHGIRHPRIRNHPAVEQTTRAALDTAFGELNLLKVKAEFPASNRGARGFCLRWHFEKEAHFKADTYINHHPEDIVVYSLFAQTYRETVRRTLNHVVWQKQEQKLIQENQHPCPTADPTVRIPFTGWGCVSQPSGGKHAD